AAVRSSTAPISANFATSPFSCCGIAAVAGRRFANPSSRSCNPAASRDERSEAVPDQFDLPRRLAAEALGTGILVATVVGSGIMAETLTRDVALALLCNTLPTGAILVVLITVLGPIS